MSTGIEKYANMKPSWDSPVIIESHINGFRTREMTPKLPITYDEIAKDGIECLDAGSCAIHTHNSNFDLKSEDAYDDYMRSWSKILEKYPDAILYGTTCNTHLLTKEEHGLEHVDVIHNKIGAQLCVMDPGLTNLAQGEDEEGFLYGMTHGYNFEQMNGQIKMCRKNNMGIIFSVYEPGFLRLALHYYNRGLLPKGSSIDFYLIGDYGLLSTKPVNTAGAPATLESLYYYLNMMEGCELPWYLSIWGAGSEIEIPLMRRAIELGGHLKVGLEMHYDPVHKPTNLELLKQAQQIASEVGRPIATPEQAKEILGLK